MELLSDEQIAEHLSSSDWKREGDEIVREWEFENFVEAMKFVNAVAEAAEEANHHPDILLHGWNKVRLSLTNHSEGGLTEPSIAELDTYATAVNKLLGNTGVRFSAYASLAAKDLTGLGGRLDSFDELIQGAADAALPAGETK